MGQKLVVLLDSDMTQDVKRLFFSLLAAAVDSHFCERRGSALHYVAVKVSSQEGTGSGVTPGQDWMLLQHSCSQEHMWTLFKYNQSRRRSHGVPLRSAVSSYLAHCIIVRSKLWLPESRGSTRSSFHRTQRWISSLRHVSGSQSGVCGPLL